MPMYDDDEPDCAIDSDDDDLDQRHYGQRTASPSTEGQPQAREEMHEIIPLLWIGDFQASQRTEHLKSLGISVVVAAMRQRYAAAEGITVHQVAIEDNDRTNVMAHFSRVNEIIHDAHAKGQGVLVHCQAGVSRSTTLVAAFLMHDLGLTCDEAVHKISVKRSIVRPTEFFLHQLEMYERMGCEVDPAVHSEYRRFLMNFHHVDLMDGDGGETLYLAYYPSPAVTPRDRSPSGSDPFGSLRMTPFESSNSSPSALTRANSGSSTTSIPADVQRMRDRKASLSEVHRKLSMTTADGSSQQRPSSRSSARRPSRLAMEAKEAMKAEAQAVREGKAAYLKVGQGRVVVKGKRLRCKMCNRELAARQHILEHEPGEGQQAFAPRRRDMAQHREEVAKRKEADAKRAERRAAKAAAAAESAAEQAPYEQSVLPAEALQARADKQASSTPTVDPPLPVHEQAEAVASKGEGFAAVPATTEQRPIVSRNSSTTLADRLPAHLSGLRVALPPPFRPPAPSASPAPSLASTISTSASTSTPPPPSPPLLAHRETCSSYFVEPLSWMADQLENGDLGGRITCPNARCAAKLGSFDWAGQQCSCGSWVVPGFALQCSKVDEVG